MQYTNQTTFSGQVPKLGGGGGGGGEAMALNVIHKTNNKLEFL